MYGKFLSYFLDIFVIIKVDFVQCISDIFDMYIYQYIYIPVYIDNFRYNLHLLLLTVLKQIRERTLS